MGLSIGIVGLPNVGKSTLLNALTHAGAEASNYPFCTIEQNVGITSVPDPNLGRLAELLSPEETTPTTIRFVDIAGLVHGASKGEGLGNKFLSHIREVDAILHVVRCFDDPNVAHTPGGPDPVRDVEIVETELLLADLETAERALDKLQKTKKLGKKIDTNVVDAMTLAIEALGDARPISALELPLHERDSLTEWRFLTAKPVLYLANTGEGDPRGTGPMVELLRKAKGSEKLLVVSVEIEEEIAELPPEDQMQFLKELDLDETALDLVITACYELLDLLTFYTIANDRVQAWQLPRGGTAVEAAGRIHSDMADGFIRAEVMALDDLAKWGDRHALHDQGLLHTVGRDYVVSDKDILQIHFKA